MDVRQIDGVEERLQSEGRRLFEKLTGWRRDNKTQKRVLAQIGDYVSIWGEETGQGSQHWVGKICCFWQRDRGELLCCVRWMCQPEFTVVRTAAHPSEIYATDQYCHDVNIVVSMLARMFSVFFLLFSRLWSGIRMLTPSLA